MVDMMNIYAHWTFYGPITGSCELLRDRDWPASDEMAGGAGGEAYSSRVLSGRVGARGRQDGLGFDPPVHLDRW